VLVSVDGSGQLSVGRTAGKNFDAGPLRAQAQQQVAALNAQLAAAGLRLPGGGDIGWIGGGGSGNPGDLSALLARSRVGVRANDARTQGAIDRLGDGSLASSLAIGQEATQLIAALDGFAQAAADAQDPLAAVRRQFEGAIEAARRLGFGLDEVVAAQERALAEARQQRNAAAAGQATGVIGSLADYARSLRTANDNSQAPLSRLLSASELFNRDANAALAGDFRATSRLQASAETFRSLSRDVYGTGTPFAQAEARIADVLDRLGNVGAEALTASAQAAIAETQTETLVAALGRLQSEVASLRRDVQQQAANPLTGRVA
jgi:hypothetical protein